MESNDPELLLRIFEALAKCDHDWGPWEWREGTATSKGGWAKQCPKCRTWLYDIVTNHVP
jgi:hypothetical protein